MKPINMEYETSTNIKIKPKNCPLGKSCCYESLGGFEKACEYNGGFYCDTKDSICKFDEETSEKQKVCLEIYAKMKDK